MPAFFTADGDHDPSWFSGFENDNHLIGFCCAKVRIDKLIPSALWCFQNGRAPFLGTILNPIAKLLGDIAQTVASNPLALPISVKETDYSFGLLKRLNQPIQKNPIETTVAEFDAIVMVFAEGVHRLLLGGQIPGTYRDKR